MLQHFHERSSILCPALPVNGRIVRDGILYINGVPLAESPMKNHPLTPMWDSSLKNLMEAQSEYTCFDVPHETLYDDIELENLLEDLNERYDHYYLIPDYKDEHDAARIAQKFGDLQVLSGGSGILTELGRYYVRKYHEETAGEVMPPSGTAGRALVLAGSCSVATLGQIKTFAQEGNVTMQINPHELMQGTLKARDLWEQYKAQTRPALIYSSDSADKVQALQQRYGKDELAAAIENLMTELTRLAYADGFTRFIVAGGETSGAVMKGLPADGYLIDASVAPGVPVMVPSKHPAIRLVLKSGNFGDSRFFSKALQMTADK